MEQFKYDDWYFEFDREITKEYYKDNKINFDYVLRRGKSETQNAKHLMKLAGIDIED